MTITETKDYVSPNNAGLASEPHAVGRRIGKTLDALASMNKWVCEGPIENECWEFRTQLIENLRASGWTVKMGANGSFRVTPPKGKCF